MLCEARELLSGVLPGCCHGEEFLDDGGVLVVGRDPDVVVDVLVPDGCDAWVASFRRLLAQAHRPVGLRRHLHVVKKK